MNQTSRTTGYNLFCKELNSEEGIVHVYYFNCASAVHSNIKNVPTEPSFVAVNLISLSAIRCDGNDGQYCTMNSI